MNESMVVNARLSAQSALAPGCVRFIEVHHGDLLQWNISQFWNDMHARNGLEALPRRTCICCLLTFKKVRNVLSKRGPITWNICTVTDSRKRLDKRFVSVLLVAHVRKAGLVALTVRPAGHR